MTITETAHLLLNIAQNSNPDDAYRSPAEIAADQGWIDAFGQPTEDGLVLVQALRDESGAQIGS
ncbi:MAG: hypothetical protein AAGF59_04635 [Pseudomonadota bacterium]